MTSKAEQPSAPHLQDPAVSEDIDTGRMRAVHGAKYSVCDLYRVLWEHEGEGLLKGESARKCRGTGTWAESKGMSLPNIKGTRVSVGGVVWAKGQRKKPASCVPGPLYKVPSTCHWVTLTICFYHIKSLELHCLVSHCSESWKGQGLVPGVLCADPSTEKWYTFGDGKEKEMGTLDLSFYIIKCEAVAWWFLRFCNLKTGHLNSSGEWAVVENRVFTVLPCLSGNMECLLVILLAK